MKSNKGQVDLPVRRRRVQPEQSFTNVNCRPVKRHSSGGDDIALKKHNFAMMCRADIFEPFTVFPSVIASVMFPKTSPLCGFKLAKDSRDER